MDFTRQYLLKSSLSSVMICFIHTWFIEHMSSTCRTINSKQNCPTMLGYSLTKNSQYQCSHSQGKHDSQEFSILARSSTFPMKTVIGISNNLRHCYTNLAVLKVSNCPHKTSHSIMQLIIEYLHKLLSDPHSARCIDLKIMTMQSSLFDLYRVKVMNNLISSSIKKKLTTSILN